MGGNNENDRVASPASVPIHLKSDKYTYQIHIIISTNWKAYLQRMVLYRDLLFALLLKSGLFDLGLQSTFML